jgi:hypothetical protein
MLLISLLLLLVNAVTLRREFKSLLSRVAIFILLYSGIIGYDSLYVTYLDNGIGIYNGLFHSTAITHSFDLFIYIIAPIILLLTAFDARRIVQPIIPYNRFVGSLQNGLLSAEGPGYVKAYRNAVMGRDASQFTFLVLLAYTVYILVYHPDSFYNYASLALSVMATKPSSISGTQNKFHPNYVTGLSDGEGCFYITVHPANTGAVQEH